MHLLRRAVLICWAMLFTVAVSGQKQSYYDGPYIYQEEDSLVIQWVAKGAAYDTMLLRSSATFFDVDALPKVDLQKLRPAALTSATYTDVDEVFAVSDIHGQYDLFRSLLKANKITDEDGKWAYDSGHLVIVGDNFDRGDGVIELLWYLYDLQQQAEDAGGMVHVMLGNHEVMVLNNDLRYLHKKYYYTSALFKTRYDQFFRKGSILGDWLSSHPVLLSINKNLFVHGGISTAFLGLNQSIDQVNQTFVDHLIRKDLNTQNEELSLLSLTDGPLWYRGYFDSTAVRQADMEMILDNLNQSAIIVGHTSLKTISSLYEGKVIAVDCSIKLGLDAQGLKIKNKRYYVADTKGKKKRIQGPYDKAIVSLYNYLYHLPERANITIETDIRNLIRTSSKEEYQPANLMVVRPDSSILTLEGRARARGNIRKKVCRYPPVKFDFSKSYLDSLGFVKNDKLKLVFPCSTQKDAQLKLYKEFFLYELYNVIDTNGLRAKLLDITINYEGEEKNNFTGFLVEDEEEYALRKNARVLENGKIRASSLDRSSFLKMLFFQYMICNTDWDIASKHNVELVKLPEEDKLIALPYDFDYSGYVDQHYAVPHESLPIEDVKERYFMPYKVSEGEFNAIIKYYLSIEKEVYAVVDQADYLGEREQKQSRRFFKDFFDLLRYPNRIKGDIINR